MKYQLVLGSSVCLRSAFQYWLITNTRLFVTLWKARHLPQNVMRCTRKHARKRTHTQAQYRARARTHTHTPTHTLTTDWNLHVHKLLQAGNTLEHQSMQHPHKNKYTQNLSAAAPQRENIYFGPSCFPLLRSSAKSLAEIESRFCTRH